MQFLEPMFATATEHLPTNGGWLYEPKFDGLRIQAHAVGADPGAQRVELFSRKGRKLTKQFPEIVEAVRHLRHSVGQDFAVDAEIVSAADDGFTGFQRLQSRIGVEQPFRIWMLAEHNPAELVCFDVLRVADHALTKHALTQRRQVLAALLSGPETAVRLALQSSDRAAVLAHAHAHGLEGVVAKQASSAYRSGERGPCWLKYKFALRQEFVVAGYTASESTTREFGALVLGYYVNGTLMYAGRVGTGFSQQALAETARRLRPLASATCPLAARPALTSAVTWVQPQVVVEVRFQEWTNDGHIRFPRYLGHRDDKHPHEVFRET